MHTHTHTHRIVKEEEEEEKKKSQDDADWRIRKDPTLEAYSKAQSETRYTKKKK